MKKFSKILFLILSLAVMVTAFSVVAFAEEELAPIVKYDEDYTGEAVGTQHETNDTGYGYFGVDVQEGSDDPYLILRHDKKVDVEDGSSSNSYMSGVYYYGTEVSNTPLSTYPYVSFEFDIMRIGKSHSEFFISTYVKGASNGPSTPISYAELMADLPKEAFTWAHVNVIFNYTSETVDSVKTGYVGYDIYVNGVKAYSASKVKSFTFDESGKYAGATESALYFTDLRLGANTGNYSLDKLSAFDNVKLTVYPSSYSVERIVAESYTKDYVFPYAKTLALVDGKGYDNMDEAFAAAAAKSGSTVSLRSDVEGVREINSEMKIDTNIYDAEGVATGEFYNFEVKNTAGYIGKGGYTVSCENGVYTITKSSVAANVVWDPENQLGQSAAFSATVPAGYVPTYEGKNAFFDEGREVILHGWSYTKDGEAEDISAITAEDAALEAIYLYPVFTETQYAFSYTDNDGVTTYHAESEFEEKFASVVGKGVTKIVLYSDVEFESAQISYAWNTLVTFDLNGHSLKRLHKYGSVYNKTLNAETGEYEYVAGTAVKASCHLFYFPTTKEKMELNFISDKPGSKFYSVNVNGKFYYDENGALERFEALNTKGGGFIAPYGVKKVTVNVENVDMYLNSFIYGAHGGNTTIEVNVTNSKMYVMPGAETSTAYGENFMFIESSTGEKIKVKFVDSQIYFPSNKTITGGHNELVRFLKTNNKATVEFNNCDIVSTTELVGLRTAGTLSTVIFNNCRVGNIYDYQSNNKRIFADGTVYVTPTTYPERTPIIPDGLVSVNKETTKTYFVPVVERFTLNEDGSVNFNIELTEKSYSFDHAVMTYDKAYVKVTWIGLDGKVVAEGDLLRETNATAPKYHGASDGYIAAKVTEWTDAEGNVSDLFLGDAESYVFTAVAPVIDENTEYMGAIAGAQFNFIYYGQFHTVLYLPVDERVENPAVSGFIASYYNVKINGENYWAFTKYCSTTGVSDDVVSTVYFTIDGVNYTQNFKLSALNYAKAILSAPINDTEAKAVANMVRYVKEARLAAGLEIGEQFSEVEALYALDDYKAAAEYDDLDVDYKSISDYVDSINFMIDGVSASYVLTLNEKYFGTAQVEVYYMDGYSVSLRKSEAHANSYFTINTRVYDLTKVIKIKVTIPAAEEGGEATVVTGTYSIGAYIQATDNALSKAMYEFGIAAADYRAYLISKA